MTIRLPDMSDNWMPTVLDLLTFHRVLHCIGSIKGDKGVTWIPSMFSLHCFGNCLRRAQKAYYKSAKCCLLNTTFRGSNFAIAIKNFLMWGIGIWIPKFKYRVKQNCYSLCVGLVLTSSEPSISPVLGPEHLKHWSRRRKFWTPHYKKS